HQLRRHACLKTVYSTYPWRRLQRENLPHSHVETFPWIHGGLALLARYGLYPSRFTESLDYWNALAFDEWITHRITRPGAECDALIAISGAGLKAGQKVQASGGKYICDRGSTHARFRSRALEQEYSRWNIPLETEDPRDTEREERQYAMADAITVPSNFAARSFVQEGIAPGKIHIIPYGVRLDAFHPVATPPPDEFQVIFVGQISLHKGIPYLLQAFANIRHPHKRLRLIGSVMREMKPVLSKLPLENVEMTGAVPKSQLLEYMSRSHVMVLPSIDEGFGMVQGEAMACGCPVIATTHTGAENLFTDGVEGFIVPPRDPEALADRLRRLADDPNLQRQMSAAALERVQHLGGWNDYGDRWIKLLRELCGEGPDETGEVYL
ncbi:MAG: glycosyltransferase family 4 protein, partial [Acidobacteriaceae bacterium]